MLWILLCLCVGAAVANKLQCHHPACPKVEINLYNMDNQIVQFSAGLYMYCQGTKVLDSPALPRYENELRVSNIVLINCPLPSGNATLASVFSALNIKAEPEGDELLLSLMYLPKEPKITARHFQGLEKLTAIGIDARLGATAEPAFLAKLTNLRSVSLHGFKIIENDLQNIPKSVEWFDCTEKQFDKTLQETISETTKALPGLKDLTIKQSSMLDLGKYNLKYKLILLRSMRTDVDSSIHVHASNWYEKTLTAFEQCDQRIESIEMYFAKAEELPNRWVAACTNLKKINLVAAHLTKLPANVLEGANELTDLTINARLESLPDGWLQGAPKLCKIDLSYNNIKTLSSGSFSHAPALQTLFMNRNKLNNTALGGFSALTSLRTLDLTSNKFTGNICSNKDYEPLRNMPQLTLLSLSHNNVLICNNWKKSYPHLKYQLR